MKQSRVLSPVILGAVAGVVFFCISQAAAGGPISGTVTNSAGDGVGNIEVNIYYVAEQDPSDPFPDDSVYTASGGEYSAQIPSFFTEVRVEFSDTSGFYYLGEWYDNEADYLSATTIVVDSLNGVSGKDAELSCPPPVAPMGLSASDGTYTGKVALSWLPETGAAEYEVWRSTQNSDASATLLNPTAGTNYDDTTAVPGTPYWYWVKTIDVCGDTSGFSDSDSGYAAAPDSIGVFRNGQWFLDLSGNDFWDGCAVDGCVYLGMAGDQAVAGDWDGDGDDEIGVFRNGVWYLDFSGNDFWDGCAVDGCVYLGMAGDQAVVGDWDGDGDDEIGVFRNGVWYLDFSGNDFWDGCAVDGCVYLGMAGDQAVVGDWDGDGDDEIGVFRNGVWYLDFSGNDFWDGCTVDGCVYLGMAGDQAVVGDWDGDGDDEIGVFRNGQWFLDFSGNDFWDGCAVDGCIYLGMAGDESVSGAW